MMKIYFFLIAALLIIGCNNNSSTDEATAPETDSLEIPSGIFSWQAVLDDSTGRLEMKQQDFTGPDSLNVTSVTNFLNLTYPSITLVANRQSNDTLYLNIPDALYLTQQIGSTGPAMYFATAVYNYTEIPGINFVNFNFEEGDHASPATLSRQSIILN